MCQPHCHWQTRMVSLAPSPSPSPKASPDKDDEDDKDGASSSGDDEMTISQWLALCHSWQKGGVGFESSLVFKGRVSIGRFFDRGSVYSFKGCSEVYMYFSFFLVTLTSYIQVLWPFFYDIHCTFFSYIWWWCMFFFFTYLYMCCLFSFFIHMFLYECNLYLCFTFDALMSFV